MKEANRVRDLRPAARARRLLGALTMVSSALVLLVAAPAWSASNVKDVRVGKHPAFTRIVFELDGPSGYQIERNEPAPGISELVVSIEASGTSGAIKVPKSLIEAVRLQSDGRRTVAHIRLSRDGLRHKEMTLREPARIVIDVIDDHPQVAATPNAKPKPVPAAEPTPKAKPETEKPKATAKVEAKPTPKPVEIAKAPAKVEPTPKPLAKAPAKVEAKTTPTKKPVIESKLPAAAAKPDAAALKDGDKPAAAATDGKRAASLAARDPSGDEPSDPTSPSAEAELEVPAEPSGALSSFPAAAGVPDSSGDLFTARNGALALAGIVLLAAGSFVIARRRRDSDEYDEDDEDEYGDDNPFAGLESARADEHDDDEVVAAKATSATEDQADLFAGTPATATADSGPRTINPAGDTKKTEGSEMSMDGTMDFGANRGAKTTLSAAPGAGTDLEGVMRMVRELATRVGDLETRIEDAVDAKERLERQVAAQTEELRVQRAAIARTQRAVRNMSQSVEDTPTEPAPRAPRPGE